jgi:RNA polymerase sigma-70 factor (ECF subfamily)
MKIFSKNLKNCSDETLMKFAQNGNINALGIIYDRYKNRLFVFFLRMLGGDQIKAQDFLQEVFLRIVEKPNLFDGNKMFSSWIFTIAYNLCKNEYRRLAVRKRIISEQEIDLTDILSENNIFKIDQSIDQENFFRLLYRELNKLDLIHKSTFLLRFQEGFTIKQISETLNYKEGTVKSRLFYTIQKLAVKLKHFNPNLSEVKEYEENR